MKFCLKIEVGGGHVRSRGDSRDVSGGLRMCDPDLGALLPRPRDIETVDAERKIPREKTLSFEHVHCLRGEVCGGDIGMLGP